MVHFTANFRGPHLQPGDTVMCPMSPKTRYTVVRTFPAIKTTEVRPIGGGRTESFRTAFLARVRDTTAIGDVRSPKGGGRG